MDMNDHDTLIAHSNGAAIREANGVESKAVKLTKEEVEKMTANDEEDKPKSTRRNKQVDLEDSIEEIESDEDLDLLPDAGGAGISLAFRAIMQALSSTNASTATLARAIVMGDS